MKNKPKRTVFIIAGEPSGDVFGARLMRMFKDDPHHQYSFSGVGGPLMAKEGLISAFDYQDIALMGIFEIIPHIPRILRRVRQTVQAIVETKPDLVLTIDCPGFNFRVGKKAAARGFRVVHCVAPSVWAWRPKRAEKIARFLKHLLVFLPFEPPYFTKYGLPTTYIGHPIVQNFKENALFLRKDQLNLFRKRHKIAQDARVISLLPGSRNKEIATLLPIFCEAILEFKEKSPKAPLHILIPTIADKRNVVEKMLQKIGHLNIPVTIVEGEKDKYQAFSVSDAALAASGTVTLELACAKVPTMIGYKINRLTAWTLRLITCIRFAGLPNIILGREVMPELLQEKCTRDHFVTELSKIFNDPLRLADIKQGYDEVIQMLEPSLGGEDIRAIFAPYFK